MLKNWNCSKERDLMLNCLKHSMPTPLWITFFHFLFVAAPLQALCPFEETTWPEVTALSGEPSPPKLLSYGGAKRCTARRVEEEGETIQKWGRHPHPLKLTLTIIKESMNWIELDHRVIMVALPRLLDQLGLSVSQVHCSVFTLNQPVCHYQLFNSTNAFKTE